MIAVVGGGAQAGFGMVVLFGEGEAGSFWELWIERQGQRQQKKQIPCGNDRQNCKGNYKGKSNDNGKGNGKS